MWHKSEKGLKSVFFQKNAVGSNSTATNVTFIRNKCVLKHTKHDIKFQITKPDENTT